MPDHRSADNEHQKRTPCLDNWCCSMSTETDDGEKSILELLQSFSSLTLDAHLSKCDDRGAEEQSRCGEIRVCCEMKGCGKRKNFRARRFRVRSEPGVIVPPNSIVIEDKADDLVVLSLSSTDVQQLLTLSYAYGVEYQEHHRYRECCHDLLNQRGQMSKMS
ncbi:Hypothetical predicted protein [Scomber scombrus]|uniref:Uncharacterized protein n=1 Tax=Scomber scombrus TaxID=13677 RepID=A0AAV1PN85_SCOSC